MEIQIAGNMVAVAVKNDRDLLKLVTRLGTMVI